jgi:hypothetical protein
LLNHHNGCAGLVDKQGDRFSEAIQEKPPLASMESKKDFPSGKGNIIVSVKGDFGNTRPRYCRSGAWLSADDAVTYYTPANLTQAIFPEGTPHRHHAHSPELKTDGITRPTKGPAAIHPSTPAATTPSWSACCRTRCRTSQSSMHGYE